MPRFLALFGAILVISPVQAQVLTLTDERGVYRAESRLHFLADPDRRLEIGDVATPELDAVFEPAKSGGALGAELEATGSVYWARLRIANEADPQKRWLLSIRAESVDYLDVYTSRAGQEGFSAVKTGTALPFSSREVPDRRFVFKLPLADSRPDDTAAVDTAAVDTVFIRLESDESILFRAMILSSDAYLVSRIGNPLFNA